MLKGQSSESVEEDWYNMPLYYDIIFDQDTTCEAEFLEQVFARHSDIVSSNVIEILEPACGSGRLLHALSRMGHNVTGFDISPAMLEFSKSRLIRSGFEPNLYQMGMDDFEIARDFDMAFCLVSTFKYLLDEQSARAHLRQVAHHLKEGAIYVLGFHLSDYSKLVPQREEWNGVRNGTEVECVIDSDPPDPDSRLEHMRCVLNVQNKGKKKTVRTNWNFRTYDAVEVRTLLASVPELSLEACYDFCYDINEPRELDSPWEDVVMILKKLPGKKG